MDVMIIATKDCSHCANLTRELKDLGIEHHVVYAEDEPELVKKYSIRHSPNLVVGGEVKYRRQPNERELRDCFNC